MNKDIALNMDTFLNSLDIIDLPVNCVVVISEGRRGRVLNEWKLERTILYILVIVLFTVLIALTIYMNFTMLDLSFNKDVFINLSSFIGALLGALITGVIAIGLIVYQRYNDKKDYYFQSYGHMKYVAIRLVVISELKKLTLKSIEPIQGKYDHENELHQKLLSIIPLDEFTKLLDVLNQLKDNVPYEYVSRFYAAINSLEYLNVSLKRLVGDVSDPNITVVLIQLEAADRILLTLSENLLIYTNSLEKKYGISDAY